MKKFQILCFFILAYSINSYSQKKDEIEKKDKFFLTAGYGLAGSFFVRSYGEFAPLPTYKAFYKKNFIGLTQNFALGINIKNNYQIRFGLNFQQFTREIKTDDTLNNVIINLDHTIHHRDYIWHIGLNKNFERKKHIFSPGLGIYYVRPKQEEIDIYYPSRFTNIERGFKKYNLEEAGVYAEFAYEYKFQSKVNLGIRTQFYYTASAGYAESVTLFPYVKISF